MGLALAEARKGEGMTSPNPAVGAVLVREGQLLAKGYHRQAGAPHAEQEVLSQVSDATGATLYVTLEPCCHTRKRTPPCVPSLQAAGLKRVVVACRDPNPQVSGAGLRALRRAGLEVSLGVLQRECEELNRFYNHWIQTGLPYVVLKMAASLDGKVALSNGKSRWISSEAARQRVHKLRTQVDAIAVGVGTVLADNPRLTARVPGATRQPLRLVFDPRLRLPVKSRVLREPGALVVVTSVQAARGKPSKLLEAAGAEILPLPLGRHGLISLKKALRVLGRRGVTSLLVEGGPKTWTEFLRQGAVQEIQLYWGSCFLGGDAQSLLAPLGLRSMARVSRWQMQEIELLEGGGYVRLVPPA